jgi:pyruvate,water dikinase
MSIAGSLVKPFDEIAIDDLPSVGGKNASLGEIRRALSSKGVHCTRRLGSRRHMNRRC